MMLSFLVTFLGSKVGRYIALGVLFAAALGLAYWRVFQNGVQAEQTKQMQENLEALRKKIANDQEITNLTPDQRRERLRQWVR